MTVIVKKLVLARQVASAGVDYSPRRGALCPWCGEKAKITSSKPWEENTKVRYHRCENTSCPLSTMKINIKSIEVDLCPKPATLKERLLSAQAK